MTRLVPCPDPSPHDEHEWIGEALRNDCPGVPELSKCESSLELSRRSRSVTRCRRLLEVPCPEASLHDSHEWVDQYNIRGICPGGWGRTGPGGVEWNGWEWRDPWRYVTPDCMNKRDENCPGCRCSCHETKGTPRV